MPDHIIRWIIFILISVNLFYILDTRLYSDLRVYIRQTDHTLRNGTTIVDTIDSNTKGKRKITGFNKQENCVEVSTINEHLIKLFKEIQKAKIHVRGSKTRYTINNALLIITDLLKKTKINKQNLKRKTKPSKHISEEVYQLNRGFKTQKCSYSTSIEKLVTVLIVLKPEESSNLQSTIKSLFTINKHIQIIIGKLNVERISILERKYTLIAREVSSFNIDARLERLVREIESLDVVIAGGASRDQNGIWKLGCYQTTYANYSLVYHEGYDESLHECIFCDYINGPFISKTNALKRYNFDNKMNAISVFHDFFLRISQNRLESVVCPDSLFYVEKQQQSAELNGWSLFNNKWQLFRLKIADEVDIKFECKNQKQKCHPNIVYMSSPCCLQELTDMIKFIMNTCETFNIICEADGGTVLGAVKFNKILPWEKDADFRCLTSNFTSLK
ncbi:FKRP [Mytilus coruscus]|uniref:FKRP n=1 Tax=Mytilus coruscus TaxID=42192 RepID=A0A6J8DS02_MYTCO|nr:FKRP [Mytilus coruscus]